MGENPKVLGTEQLAKWEREEQVHRADEFLIYVQVKGKKAYIKSTGLIIS